MKPRDHRRKRKQKNGRIRSRPTLSRRCEVCEGPSGPICRDCLRARKILPKPIQRVRKALFWRVRHVPTLTPGQVNYALRVHWNQLPNESQRALDRALERHFGPTQTAYEALLHFGLHELNRRGRLREFPEDLRQLQVIARKEISQVEIAELHGSPPPILQPADSEESVSRHPEVIGDPARQLNSPVVDQRKPRWRDRVRRWLAMLSRMLSRSGRS